MQYRTLSLLIDGEWIDATGRDEVDVVNPSTAEVLGRLPVATASDVDQAARAAARGFEIWSALSAYERADVLHRAASLLRERTSRIA